MPRFTYTLVVRLVDCAYKRTTKFALDDIFDRNQEMATHDTRDGIMTSTGYPQLPGIQPDSFRKQVLKRGPTCRCPHYSKDILAILHCPGRIGHLFSRRQPNARVKHANLGSLGISSRGAIRHGRTLIHRRAGNLTRPPWASVPFPFEKLSAINTHQSNSRNQKQTAGDPQIQNTSSPPVLCSLAMHRCMEVSRCVESRVSSKMGSVYGTDPDNTERFR